MRMVLVSGAVSADEDSTTCIVFCVVVNYVNFDPKFTAEKLFGKKKIVSTTYVIRVKSSFFANHFPASHEVREH